MSNNEPVLIIDDSLNDADFARIILKESGFDNVFHATNLNDAVEMLKTNEIRRVVLDLGGIVKGSSNPMATLDSLEKEGISDLQVVVLTGNKNPVIKEQVEQRGYQCLTKDSALDLVENSTLLPEALTKLLPSYVHADLNQDILIRELFLKKQVLEDRVIRLESLIDQLLLAKMDNSGIQENSNKIQEILLSFRFLDTRVTHMEVLRNQFSEVSIRQDYFQQQVAEIKTHSTHSISTIDSLVKEVKDLTTLAEENEWLITFIRHGRKIVLFFIGKAKEVVFKYMKMALVCLLTSLVASSPAWFPIVKKMPELQKVFKWAIENLAK